MNSIKAGFLDLEGCTIVDLLPRYTMPSTGTSITAEPEAVTSLPHVLSVRMHIQLLV